MIFARNFKEGGGYQVKTSAEIAKEMDKLLNEPDRAMPETAKVLHQATMKQTVAQLAVAYQLARLNEHLSSKS